MIYIVCVYMLEIESDFAQKKEIESDSSKLCHLLHLYKTICIYYLSKKISCKTPIK